MWLIARKPNWRKYLLLWDRSSSCLLLLGFPLLFSLGSDLGNLRRNVTRRRTRRISHNKEIFFVPQNKPWIFLSAEALFSYSAMTKELYHSLCLFELNSSRMSRRHVRKRKEDTLVKVSVTRQVIQRNFGQFLKLRDEKEKRRKEPRCLRT